LPSIMRARKEKVKFIVKATPVIIIAFVA